MAVSVALFMVFVTNIILTSCTDDVDPLTAVTEQQGRQIASLEGLVQQQATKMEAMETLIQQQAETIKQQAATITSIQNTLHNVSTQLDLLTPLVAFDVHFKDDPKTGLADHDVMKFNYVSMNIGNGYNVNSGMFQAPVAGYYLLHVKISPNVAGVIYVYVVKEGSNIDSVYARDSSGEETGDTVRVVHLAKGERLWLVKHSGLTTVRGWMHTTLAGFLLRAT